MRTVLAAFDGAHFPQAILDFVLELHQDEPIQLKGIFLPSIDYTEVISYLYYGNAVVPPFLPAMEEDPGLIKRNMDRFESFCRQHNIHYLIHNDAYGHIPVELRMETRYADLLVICNPYFYENLDDGSRTSYREDTLHAAECPVVLLPEKYSGPKKIIFAYDGSMSAMFAIKQFCYLMPAFRHQDITVVYAAEHKTSVPFEQLIAEYTQVHFRQTEYYILDVDPRKYFDTWLQNEGQAILISGAYGRSAFSELFRQHFIKDVIQHHNIPLFIAHV